MDRCRYTYILGLNRFSEKSAGKKINDDHFKFLHSSGRGSRGSKQINVALFCHHQCSNPSCLLLNTISWYYIYCTSDLHGPLDGIPSAWLLLWCREWGSSRVTRQTAHGGSWWIRGLPWSCYRTGIQLILYSEINQQFANFQCQLLGLLLRLILTHTELMTVTCSLILTNLLKSISHSFSLSHFITFSLLVTLYLILTQSLSTSFSLGYFPPHSHSVSFHLILIQSLSTSFSLSHFPPHPHSVTFYLILTQSLSTSFSLGYFPPHSHSVTFYLILTQSVSTSFSLSHFPPHSHSVTFHLILTRLLSTSFSLSHFPPHSHSVTISLGHFLIHSHFLSHSHSVTFLFVPSLSHILARSQSLFCSSSFIIFLTHSLSVSSSFIIFLTHSLSVTFILSFLFNHLLSHCHSVTFSLSRYLTHSHSVTLFIFVWPSIYFTSLLMMINTRTQYTGGARTCRHLHESRPLYHCATDCHLSYFLAHPHWVTLIHGVTFHRELLTGTLSQLHSLRHIYALSLISVA